MLKQMALGLYHSTPGLFHSLRFISPSYYRSKKSARAYRHHYAAARANFSIASDDSVPSPDAVCRMGVQIIYPNTGSTCLTLPADYAERVNRVSASVAKQFETADHCFFFPRVKSVPPGTLTANVPEIREGDVITAQLRDYTAVAGLSELCEAMLPVVEKHVYGSHVMVDKVYIYRNLVSRQAEQISWLWHYDNHPEQILKAIVYLTDVGDNDGPLEYLVSSSTGSPLKIQPIPNLTRPFIETRVSRQRLEGYLRAGYRPFKLTGPKGTTALFSDNIVHKANIAKGRHRDVVVFQFRPSLSAAQRGLDPRWTGSFQHIDVTPDPYRTPPLPKPVMASG